MKSFTRKIDRFCALHPNFGIRNLMLCIVIGNAAVWLLSMMDTTNTFAAALAFNAEAVFTRGQVWRLVTFVFVPESFSFWMVIAMYFYYSIGSTLEAHWGKGKFTVYYLCGMALNIIYGTLMYLLAKRGVYLTATYINLSMFFAFATIFPDAVFLLFFIIPVKAKWMGIANAAIFLLAMVTTRFPMNLLPLVAMLNYLIFCGGWLFDMFRPQRIKQKQNTINFKKAAKEYNRKQAQKPFTRKCEVCGRTDRDDPNLEFRFCSKCQGYHCFCIDHINSHVHFKE